MSTNRLALRAYRALLTQARAVGARGSDTLTVRLPVEGSWGHGQTFHGSEKYRRAVQRYLGDLAQTSQMAFLSGDVEPVRYLVSHSDRARPLALPCCCDRCKHRRVHPGIFNIRMRTDCAHEDRLVPCHHSQLCQRIVCAAEHRLAVFDHA